MLLSVLGVILSHRQMKKLKLREGKVLGKVLRWDSDGAGVKAGGDPSSPCLESQYHPVNFFSGSLFFIHFGVSLTPLQTRARGV